VDSSDGGGRATKRVAGDTWLFVGPGTYIPQAEVEVVELQRAIVLRPDEGLVLKARLDFRDAAGVARKAGELWMVRNHVGSYIPRVEEEVVRHVQAVVLTPRVALHLRAVTSFQDVYGVQRKAGEEWLVTVANAECHIPDVNETVVKMANIVALTSREYCVIRDPWDAERKANQLGMRRLVQGPLAFFLQPGEALENNIESTYLLGPSSALLVRAREEFVDNGTTRRPGSSWLVYGPRAYVPPTQVEVRAGRQALLNLEALNIFMFFWFGQRLDHQTRAP
jgi:major vault protein